MGLRDKTQLYDRYSGLKLASVRGLFLSSSKLTSTAFAQALTKPLGVLHSRQESLGSTQGSGKLYVGEHAR